MIRTDITYLCHQQIYLISRNENNNAELKSQLCVAELRKYLPPAINSHRG